MVRLTIGFVVLWWLFVGITKVLFPDKIAVLGFELPVSAAIVLGVFEIALAAFIYQRNTRQVALVCSLVFGCGLAVISLMPEGTERCGCFGSLHYISEGSKRVLLGIACVAAGLLCIQGKGTDTVAHGRTA